MAAYTWIGTTSNWSTSTNWSPSAPAGGPTSADTVTINNTAACTVTANSSCLTIDFTGYTGTFTINSGFTLTVFGTAITLATGMTYNQGTTGILSTLGNQTAITITFAGITIPNLTIGKTTVVSTQTVTISGTTPTIKNLVVTNGNTNSTTTLAGTPITITSSLNINGTGPLTGTLLTFTGTCTITNASSTGYINNGFTVTTGSSLQMLSTIYVGTGTITFAGTATLNPGTFTLFYPNLGNASIDSGTVTWYDVSYNVNGGTLTLLSNLNVSRDFGCLNSTFTGAFSINIGRNANLVGSSSTLNAATSINLIGTGLLLIANQHSGGTININTTNPLGYTLGSVTYPTTFLNGTAFNLVGTSVAQVYSTTGHTLQVGGVAIISTNNTATGAGIIGGSEIIWGNLLASNNTGQFTYESTFLGNLTSSSANGQFLGAKIKVAGNLSVATLLSGTSTIELIGSTNTTMSAGQYQNNIIVNKSSGAIVTTATGTITWGTANRTLTMNSAVNFLTNSTTVTLSGTPLTINDTFGNSFVNINIPASTLNINGGVMRITSNLTLTGLGAIFAGAFGWDCNNLICSIAGTFNITLQELLTYRTRSAVSITGGLATAARPTITSSTSNLAIWTLDPGATQTLIYVNGTNIDSSAGQTVWTFGGIVSAATKNWNVGTRPGTSAYTFVN
jgi:hypothetical protein